MLRLLAVMPLLGTGLEQNFPCFFLQPMVAQGLFNSQKHNFYSQQLGLGLFQARSDALEKCVDSEGQGSISIKSLF